MRLRRGIIIAVAVVVVLLIGVLATAGFWVNWLWFGSLGLRSVLVTRYTAQWALFLGAAVIAAVFFGLNVRFAARGILGKPVVVQGQQLVLGKGLVNAVVLVGSLLVGLLLGSDAGSDWSLVLAFLNRTTFGVTEPIYNRDAAFYVFTVPLLEAARSWLLGLFILTLIAVGALAFLRYSQGLARRQFSLPHDVRGQLSLLGALTLLLFSFSYWLANFDLLFSHRGVVQGASRADIFAQRPANYVLLAVSLIAAALLAWNAFARHWRPLIITVGAWAVAAVVVGLIFPAAYQSFVVKPSELRQERPYIANNIALTRRAYNLDQIQTGQLKGDQPIQPQAIASNQTAIDNIRLWDYRPLLTTYRQIQRFRQYYEFDDIDIDRYQINANSVESQTMLSARELETDLLDPRAQTWQTRHLIYTHGYGAVVSPVNRFNSQGQPDFYVKNIPPDGTGPLQISRPQIYFGARTTDYAIVKTREREFDHPSSDANSGEVYSQYDGSAGVPIGSPLNRLLFAAAFGDANIVLSSSLTGDSRILFHRDIADRVHRVAPFLTLDSDPYMVILDGKLLWIQDAYTTTSRFPYSTPASELGPDGNFNYIRNSVKITVDAYTGEIHFYVVDESDALIQTYRKIYPQLFTPLSAAPAGLTNHFRYTEDLFNVQADLFRRYHMTDPQTFYNQEDLWRVAEESYADKVQRMEAYYVTMTLPGESKEEFALILPFTPAGQGRNNMVAWMAARSDGANYGKLEAFAFPQGSNILGPQQVEARVNQEPDISAQLTLLNQSGSSVIRGNLLVFPMGEALLYVQPLYLQATTNPLPELQRVIVTSSSPDQGVVMSDRLDTALNALAQGRKGIVMSAPGTPNTSTPPSNTGQPAQPGTLGDLAQQALDHYNRAQAALKQGDWATYGQEMGEVEKILRQMSGR
ncbi:MAG: UPF0182 family membrane protein [Thermomicrobiales bacterium]